MGNRMRRATKFKSRWLGYLVLNLMVVVSGCAMPNTDLPDPPAAGQAISEDTERAAETATSMSVEPESKTTQTPSSVAESLDHQALLDTILYAQISSDEAEAILTQISDSSDTRFVAGLIDTLRYRRDLATDVARVLNTLTGQDLPADWFEWVEWAGSHPEIKSFSAYPGWKAKLFSNIDPNFLRFLYSGVRIAPDSRVEEIVWGGVLVDGIPALDNPTMIDPVHADYLVPHERVFGVSINGDTRAYPARFLDWHEMFNDIVGGEPVSLAY